MEYSKNRFEAFSDGVMVIIITIMVLSIPLTENLSFSGIINLLYSIFIFFVGFFIVGSFWNKHHKLIDSASKITNKLVWKNLVFLFSLASLPIFTKWVLENPSNLIPVIAYDILFIFVNISYFIIVKEIGGDRSPGRQIDLSKIEVDGNSNQENPQHTQPRKSGDQINNASKMSNREKIESMGAIKPFLLHIIATIVLGIIIIALAIIFPEITLILFIGFPILFSLMNLFFEDREHNQDDFPSKQ